MFAQYLLARAAHFALLLVVVSGLCFSFARMAPGGFYDELKLDPQIAPGTAERLRARYAPDIPIAQQYASWLRSIFAGDFGYSLAHNRPVSDLLWTRLPRTLLLTTAAVVLTWLMAIPAGLWCAARAGSLFERFVSLSTSIVVSIPELILCLLLLDWAARTGTLPRAGHIGPPLLILVLASFPAVYRHVYSAARAASSMPCIDAARAHGIRGFRLWVVYVLRAAANPLISLFGASAGALASASLLVELLLSWPGVGPLFVEAISARDTDIVAAVVLVSAVVVAVGNLTADLLLFASDPRIRMESR